MRRLLLGHGPRFVGDIKAVQSILSPAYMPNLVHLGIQCAEHESSRPHELFISILPQLETLGILDGQEGINTEEGTALFREIARLGNNLKHLSLSIQRFDFEAFLFGEAAGLELESLHTDTCSFANGRDFEQTSSRFSAVIKGEEETIKIIRIVMYQPPLESGRRTERMHNIDLEWRDKDSNAGFEYFNGK